MFCALESTSTLAASTRWQIHLDRLEGIHILMYKYMHKVLALRKKCYQLDIAYHFLTVCLEVPPIPIDPSEKLFLLITAWWGYFQFRTLPH